MKRIIKKASVLLLVAVLAMALSVTAFADSTVTYYGVDRGFKVEADDDMFDAFKDVMPGDVRTENITVINLNTDTDMTLIYLQAIPHTPEEGPHVDVVKQNEDYESMMEFLSQLTLTVKQDGEIISQDTADKPAGLEEMYLLALFRGRGRTDIEVTLEVPSDMGNEFAYRWGEIDWLFGSWEEDDPPGPITGDENNAAMYAALLCLSAAALAMVLVKARKKA